MTRRNFLTSLLSAFLGVLGLAFFSKSKQWIYNFAILFKPRLDPLSPTGTLSINEMENVVAFGEVVIGKRTLSETEKGYLSQHISNRTKNTQGFFAVYRSTANLLARLAPGSDFSSLSLEQRLKILISHGLINNDVQAREYFYLFHRQELTVRTLAIPDVIHGYYVSPAGWAVVSYETFPGRCGDLSRYTRAEI
jgi:hypothetical protein